MKKFTFVLAVSLLPLFLAAQNPFAKFGYDVPTVTSSKGDFEEFHDNKDVVEIGSVKYNVKTKEIIGFVETEKFEKEVSVVNTAMSIDPLCEKYYWISPYAYCLNNPVKYIDPDGREVWAIFEDENGERHQLQYKDGNLYDTKGNLYEGNNEDALAILETLNNIKKVDDFTAKVIGVLENSDKNHYIEYNLERGEDKAYPFPLTSDSYTYVNQGHKMGSYIFTTLGEKNHSENLETNKEVALGHEIRHAYDYNEGLYKGERKGRNSAKSPYEQRAVGFENRIRRAMGLPERKTYGGEPIIPYPHAN